MPRRRCAESLALAGLTYYDRHFPSFSEKGGKRKEGGGGKGPGAMKLLLQSLFHSLHRGGGKGGKKAKYTDSAHPLQVALLQALEGRKKGKGRGGEGKG